MDAGHRYGACHCLLFGCQRLHGSGYIAAFTGGLLFGFKAKDAIQKLVMAAEGIGETLALMKRANTMTANRTISYLLFHVMVK